MYSQRQPLTSDLFDFAERVDRAFACQDKAEFIKLSETDAPLPWIPAALKRWMEECPDQATGLGKLEKLALEAIC